MDLMYPNGTRYRYNYKWEQKNNSNYEYDTEGLLNKIMSKRIVESKNEVLRLVLNYFERSVVFILKYVDELKHFKNPHWKNR